MKRSLLLLLIAGAPAFAVRPDLKRLPIYATAAELSSRAAVVASLPSAAPPAPIRSLGEWEDARAAMTLWANPSLVREMSKRGKVILIADTRSDEQWWSGWLRQNGIPETNVSYVQVPTDSIWIRDYGPWPIVDGQGRYSLVHNTYNRPRPVDNQVAGRLAQAFGVPFYDTGLVHTGGNFYSDGVGNAFSSTLVFSENSNLAKDRVLDRMKEFLGIEKYVTSRLNPGITIEHMDTYGKLVAPDTFVFGEFPAGSRYKADSEAMHKLLTQLKSPYGTPYKIHRLKMSSGPGVEFRAYLNSFISNGALFYPTYGNDALDAAAKAVYQAALPKYEIVGVDAGGTGWGDSVHCRNRNLIEWKTAFLFPKVEHVSTGASDPSDIALDAIPSPGSQFLGAPEITWSVDNGAERTMYLDADGGSRYSVKLPGARAGARVRFHVTVHESSGLTKRSPSRSEIEFLAGGG